MRNGAPKSNVLVSGCPVVTPSLAIIFQCLSRNDIFFPILHAPEVTYPILKTTGLHTEMKETSHWIFTGLTLVWKKLYWYEYNHSISFLDWRVYSSHRRWRRGDRPRCGTYRSSSARDRTCRSASSSCPYRTACYSWDTFLRPPHSLAASWWPLDLQHINRNVSSAVCS
jgi:hypothetical protein